MPIHSKCHKPNNLHLQQPKVYYLPVLKTLQKLVLLLPQLFHNLLQILTQLMHE